MATSPRASTMEDELDEDHLFHEVNGQTKTASQIGSKGPNGVNNANRSPQQVADMRHILGFLNQSEWILSLNIGNIMQITPIQLEDLASLRRNEQELDRFAFLETVSFLCVGYFCVSTEIRFII